MEITEAIPERGIDRRDTNRRFSEPVFIRVEPDMLRQLDSLADQRVSTRAGVVRAALSIMFSLHEVDS